MAEPNIKPRFRRGVFSAGAVLVAVGLTLSAVLAFARHHQKQAQIDRGTHIYNAECAGCHGTKLEGQPDWKHLNAAGRLPAPPLDGTGHGWRHSNAELFHMVKYSVLDQAGPDYQTNMPAFANKLSDDEIHSVLSFIRQQWPSGIQAAQSFLNPDHAGMPDHIDGDWRLPADCEEPVRGKNASSAVTSSVNATSDKPNLPQ
jgi:mono/diheme cytochrome c family protein